MDDNYARERGLTPNRAHAELPLPEARRPGRITPAPFEVDVQVREFPGDASPVAHLVLTSGTAANKIQVTTGGVNSLTPTLGGTSLSATTPPEITVPSGGIWVWLKVIGVFGSTDSYTVTVETATTSTRPTGTEILATGFTTFHFVGSATLTSGVASIAENRSGGDLAVDSFGSQTLWWVV
jgi:hypothetical protein